MVASISKLRREPHKGDIAGAQALEQGASTLGGCKRAAGRCLLEGSADQTAVARAAARLDHKRAAPRGHAVARHPDADVSSPRRRLWITEVAAYE